jgi:hypothetical protein
MVMQLGMKIIPLDKGGHLKHTSIPYTKFFLTN